MDDNNNMNENQNMEDQAPPAVGASGGSSMASAVLTAAKRKRLIIILCSVLGAALVITAVIVGVVLFGSDAPPVVDLGLEGSGTAEDPYVLVQSGEFTPYLSEGQSMFFVYYPTEDGVISFEAAIPDTMGIKITDLTTGDSVQTSDAVIMSVVAEQGVLVELYFLNPADEDYLTFSFTDEIDNAGNYSEAPIQITGTGTYDATLASDSTKYFSYTAEQDGWVSVQLPTGVNGTVVDTSTAKEYTNTDGGDVIVVPVTADSVLDIRVKWADETASGEISLVFVDESDYTYSMTGSGSVGYPYIAPGTGSYSVDVGPGEDAYISYGATSDGTITVTVPDTADITVVDKATGDTYTDDDGDGVVVVPTTAGNELEIKTEWKDPTAEGRIDVIISDAQSGQIDEGREPVIITGTGTYSTDLDVGESQTYLYTPEGTGSIRIEAHGAVIVVCNTVTGTMFRVNDGLAVTVRAGEPMEILLCGNEGEAVGHVDMYFEDEGSFLDPSDLAIGIKTIRRYKKDGVMVNATDDAIPIMPGQVVQYEVGVKSTDNGNAWVRVRLEFVFKDKDGHVMPHTSEQLDLLIEQELNDDSWVLGEDGWWYYKKVLAGQETSSLLLESLAFSGPNITSAYARGTLEMTVICQAVQSKDNGGNAMTAQGWPIE